MSRREGNAECRPVLPAVAAVGFGTAVAMWAAGYVSRLPAVMLPSPWLLGALIAIALAGGWILGRRTGRGAVAGAAAGAVTGGLNLLILGSLLSSGEGNVAPALALVWLPGFILANAALGAVGAALGAAWARPDRPGIAYGGFTRVTVAATLLLLGVGGLVTSTGAGLAVVDWPNSFGYNMFLYPLSRMTGGIYYEHAHRLFGALVGLTTLAQALLLQRYETRRPIKVLAWLAFAMVAVQGVLGGLRVTGGFTLADDPQAMQPNLALAMVHGVFAQVCFATLVAISAFTSRSWVEDGPPAASGSARAERALALGVLAALLVQLLLGAAQRHFAVLLFAHILFGVFGVASVTLHAGFRAWGSHEGARLGRLGLALVVATGLQVGLGFVTYAVREGLGGPGTVAAITLRTAHQVVGAVLVGLGTLLACWTFRLVAPVGQQTPEKSPDPGPTAAVRRVY